MSTNIMIVDDEKDIADLVQIYLEMTVSMFLNFTTQKTHSNAQCTKNST